MPYLTGIVLAFLTGIGCRLAGFDRDRALYPIVVIVVASYYVLFAAIGGSARTVLVESTVMMVFVSMAVIGFRSSLWVIVAALAAHGVFDFVHGRLVSNPGVPAFWPAFCLGFDVLIAVFLAGLLHRGKVRARRAEPASAGA